MRLYLLVYKVIYLGKIYWARALEQSVRGLRGPIINEGRYWKTRVDTVLNQQKLKPNLENRDIITITESIIARAQGNYVTIDDIAPKTFGNNSEMKKLAFIFPIYSRNRLQMSYVAFAKGQK